VLADKGVQGVGYRGVVSRAQPHVLCSAPAASAASQHCC
jgi:hypothetical protein